MKAPSLPVMAVIMTTVTLLAILVVGVFIPERSEILIGTILTVAVPTTAALLALLRSTANAAQLTELHTKTDEIKVEAAAAKVEAATASAVVSEQVIPAVETLTQSVHELQNGHTGTPPHGTPFPDERC